MRIRAITQSGTSRSPFARARMVQLPFPAPRAISFSMLALCAGIVSVPLLTTVPAPAQATAQTSNQPSGQTPSQVQNQAPKQTVSHPPSAAPTRQQAHTRPGVRRKPSPSVTATAPAAAPPQPPAAPPAPPPPDWPVNDKPSPASVVWDSRGLQINANNSSLDQILRDVSTDIGARVEGLQADQRVFGTFGPGPANDVLSQLLTGTGYNLLLIGDQGEGTPRQIVLSQPPSGPAPANNNGRDTSSEEDYVAEQPQQYVEPPPPQPPPPERNEAPQGPPMRQGRLPNPDQVAPPSNPQ
jgi:hypothetical protein